MFPLKEEYGFDREDWKNQNLQKYPIDSTAGVKKQLGPYIKSSVHKAKHTISFTTRKQATVMQVNALIRLIEGNTPPFEYLNIFIKRKEFERVLNLRNFDELHTYILQLGRQSKVSYFKITW